MSRFVTAVVLGSTSEASGETTSSRVDAVSVEQPLSASAPIAITAVVAMFLFMAVPVVTVVET